MYPMGHMGVNFLMVAGGRRLGRRGGSRWGESLRALPLWPAVIAAVLPDVVDKIACDIWCLAPYGRNWMHNLTAVAACALAAGLLMRSRAAAASWAIGHLGHLIGDFVFIPWFYPWLQYNWPSQSHDIARGVMYTVFDLSRGDAPRQGALAIWQMS
ncbi:MAG: metal-dependent hydrolase, partial [Desulfosalsimonadaceae bacterium]